MKICHLVDVQSVLIQREVKYFAPKMDEISIITFHPIPLNFPKSDNIKIYSLGSHSKSNYKKNFKENLVQCQKKEPFKSIFQLFYRNLPKSMAILMDMEIYAYRAREIIKQIRPDIVHGHFLSHYGYIAARTGCRPLIVTAMGDDVEARPKESQLMKWTMCYSARKADKIRATANALSEQMIQYGVSADKIAVLPRGVDLNLFKADKSSSVKEKLGWMDKRIIVMVRNFYSYNRGHEYFIRALPDIIRQEPDARIILVGSGQLEHKYKKMVFELNLNNYVHFTGDATEKEVAEYLNSSDIYVATAFYDGTSNALLEAMACGLPVVVSDAPANFEWVKDGENGFVTPRKDSQTLAERLLSLLRDEALRKKMGERNFHIAQKRANREIYFNKLWDIYQDLSSCHSEAKPKNLILMETRKQTDPSLRSG